MSIQIQFLGAVGTVTGSQFLVGVGERRVLVDCGMFQGSPEEVARNRLPFAFEPSGLDAVILTHAHLDHCGRVPALVRQGYAGPIHATAATCELAEIVLRDSAHLQKEAAERWQRRAREELGPAVDAEATELETDDQALPERLRSHPPEGRTQTREPLYLPPDVDATVRLFRPVAYDASFTVTDGVRAVLRDAGHILGSAIVELEVDDDGRRRTIVFSGDLGRPNTPIIRDPTPVAHADYVVVESTYGNREHEPHERAIGELAEAIGEVAERRGVMLIPSFAIGRTQELIWVLDDLLRDGRIPRLPLFLDSPMASRATDVYERHPDAYDAETTRLARSGHSPLEYPGEQYTNRVEQSKAIRRHERPIMVVASSGMLTGGRIMHHLKDFLPDPASTLLFIGYQGEGTLGRSLQDGATTARIDGREYPVRCRVRSISGFSAHADESELMDWLRHFVASGGSTGANGAPKRVFAVHGDPEPAAAFARRVTAELGIEAVLPPYREPVTLD
ncbi:MAG TPA: MBL fold metallo-hydrolase [Candidatus Limnocylindria bacterium]|nr:MBL fold metallo-hydrolase [Candidatus Limnocylindria bacterium]